MTTGSRQPEPPCCALLTMVDHGTSSPPLTTRRAKPPSKDDPHSRNAAERFWGNTAVVIPSVGSCFKVTLGFTVALYVLNQKHLLPRPLSSVVSKVLFWPSLPITIVRRLGQWETVIDDTVVMGGAPFGFARLPERLHDDFGVSQQVMVKVCAAASLVME